ncbi:MAG: 1-deoxy-D-xylulose-5-phosphate reductoisomerase [Candidatus Omnitrophota bacterium]|nr:1-deoxy-D-xylulose-5-phosphate reductoisomerase [Candidatus Omnitrophota bacterium]
MKKRIAILGSTGSIGVNTLDVISGLGSRYVITALTADSSIRLLAHQARKYRPKIIFVGTELLAKKIKPLIPSGTEVVFGRDDLSRIVSRSDVDLVVFAISGSACLIPLVEAIRAGKAVALANKESLVSAGEIIMKLARKHNVKIIPVDSEHSAIFQCLNAIGKEFLTKIYLTGSGGPLLKVAKDKFDSLPRNFILKHPKWKMGKKISVDSATMMNKALEIIEAKHLFGMDDKSIEVLIHPEAIIHSMTEFKDGSVLAQLGTPDMRLPIQYALTYPDRAGGVVKRLDFSMVKALTFLKPDFRKFPCLGLARTAARRGGTSPAVLCASDEEAVKNYLEGRIRFSDIPKIIEKVLSRHAEITGPSLSDILKAERWAQEEARILCRR